ncbi:hypothetical protein F9L07_16920 [Pimelobacter simplex]|uniref:Glycosyltransferase RgtA/B/C/D-like domain-containing protein n=1 Tax=Nocardioides simplex TaxID=2045 RepID=A0A7J5DTZ0_NOCSI|nr:hypothetical protein [Pimelobacter simplex]KAB2808783.1 hypothetical protein F9L07_16920 [Pimelobacter simplex]
MPSVVPDRPAAPPAPRFPLLARVAPPLAGVLLAVLLVALVRRPFRAFDTYFHLRFGEEFRHDWSIAHPGQLSTASTADWVPTQWLAQVVLSWIADRAGTTGLVVTFAVLVAGFATAVHLLLRRRTGPGTAVALTAVVVLGCLPSLSLRPQLLSYLFLVVVLVAWDRARESGRAPWPLVPLAWLWATCHGMWILGVGTATVLAVAVCLERRPDRGSALRLLAVPVGMLVAALLTPAGPRLLGAVALVSSRADHFEEWSAPALISVGAAPLTLLLVAAVVLMVRRHGGTRPYDLALLALGGGFAVYSGRTVPLALVVLAAVVAAELSALRTTPNPPVRRPELAVVAALALAVVAVAPAQSLLDDPATDVRPFRDRLEALAPGSVVLTDRETGAVLLWTEPALDVPLHGYGDVYTDAELDRYDDLERLVPGWDATLAQLSPTAALLPDDAPLAGGLRQAGWSVAQHAGDLVYLRPPPAAG